MAPAVEYELTPEGLPINPHNGALPPKGSHTDNRDVKIATGCDSKTSTAASLCLKSTEALEQSIVQMVEGCTALAAFLICLLTPIIGIHGARVPSWRFIELDRTDFLASIEDDDLSCTATEMREVFRSKNVSSLTMKAMYQVLQWIRPPGEEDVDDPLSGTHLQFSHYYYGMEEWQRNVVVRLFSLIKKDMNRYEGAQWLDWKRSYKRSKEAKKSKFYDQLRAALASFAKSQGVYQDLVASPSATVAPVRPIKQDQRNARKTKQPPSGAGLKSQAKAAKGGRGVSKTYEKTAKGKRIPSKRATNLKSPEVRTSHLSPDVRGQASDRSDALNDANSSEQHIGTKKQPIVLEDANTVASNVEKTKKKAPPSVNVFHPILGHIKVFANDEHPESVELKDS